MQKKSYALLLAVLGFFYQTTLAMKQKKPKVITIKNIINGKETLKNISNINKNTLNKSHPKMASAVLYQSRKWLGDIVGQEIGIDHCFMKLDRMKKPRYTSPYDQEYQAEACVVTKKMSGDSDYYIFKRSNGVTIYDLIKKDSFSFKAEDFNEDIFEQDNPSTYHFDVDSKIDAEIEVKNGEVENLLIRTPQGKLKPKAQYAVVTKEGIVVKDFPLNDYYIGKLACTGDEETIFYQGNNGVFCKTQSNPLKKLSLAQLIFLSHINISKDIKKEVKKYPILKQAHRSLPLKIQNTLWNKGIIVPAKVEVPNSPWTNKATIAYEHAIELKKGGLYFVLPDNGYTLFHICCALARGSSLITQLLEIIEDKEKTQSFLNGLNFDEVGDLQSIAKKFNEKKIGTTFRKWGTLKKISEVYSQKKKYIKDCMGEAWKQVERKARDKLEKKAKKIKKQLENTLEKKAKDELIKKMKEIERQLNDDDIKAWKLDYINKLYREHKGQLGFESKCSRRNYIESMDHPLLEKCLELGWVPKCFRLIIKFKNELGLEKEIKQIITEKQKIFLGENFQKEVDTQLRNSKEKVPTVTINFSPAGFIYESTWCTLVRFIKCVQMDKQEIKNNYQEQSKCLFNKENILNDLELALYLKSAPLVEKIMGVVNELPDSQICTVDFYKKQPIAEAKEKILENARALLNKVKKIEEIEGELSDEEELIL